MTTKTLNDKSVIFYFKACDASVSHPVGFTGAVHIAGIGDVRYEVVDGNISDSLYDARPDPDESVMNTHSLTKEPDRSDER